MAEAKNILIFGATGVIGKIILNSILSTKSSFNRIAIFTSSGTAKSKAHELETLRQKGVEVIVGDIQDDSQILKAYDGIDTIISALGRNMLLRQIDLIRLAASSPSVRRFFPSEYGTNIKHSPASATEIVNQAKLQVRHVLEDEITSGLEYTYIVTGPWADADYPAYLGPLEDFPELGSFNVKERKAVLVGDLDENGAWKGNNISMTTTSDVGKFVTAALLHPEASRNRALLVNSFTTTPIKILAEFQRQTAGAEKEEWTVTYTSLDRLRQIEKDAWAQKHKLAPITTLRRIWAEGGATAEITDNLNIGVTETESLADAVRLAIETQLSEGPDKVDGGRVFM